MGLMRLTERFAFSAGKVDRAGPYPIVRDVLLCGLTSANNRRYLPTAFGAAGTNLYDGRPVYIDHGKKNDPRGYRDSVGWVENERRDPQGRPIGDIGVKPKHADAETFLWDAEFKPDRCGMSHVAHCETRLGADGWDEITAVVKVESVDVVGDPATTNSLFESNRRPAAVPFTIKQLAEWVTKHPKSTTAQIFKAKKLAEMDGADGAMMAAEPAADSDPNEAITAGFKAAIDAIVGKCLSGEMPWKEGRKKIDKLFGSHMDATGGDAKDAADEPADDDAEPAAEGKNKRKPTAASDPVTVLSECEKAGYRPSAAELRVLVLMPTSDRAEYVTEHRRKLAEATATNPTGASRRPGAGGVPAKVEESKAPPIDGKAFGKFISE